MLLWFGHGCSGDRTHSEDERSYGLGIDALVRTHGCSDERMHSEDERYYGLGMDALVTACSGSANVIVVWAWML